MRRRWGQAAALRFLLPVGAAFALTVLLKIIFRLIGVSFAGTAFELTTGAPSGHVEMTVAVYCSLALVLWQGWRGPIPLFAAALAAAVLVGVAITRVTLHAHTPGDVVLGFAIGGMCAATIARGAIAPPNAPPRQAIELLVLLFITVAIMQLSGLRIDSARFI
jgi:membrane-associated phospholipid phosphatase